MKRIRLISLLLAVLLTAFLLPAPARAETASSQEPWAAVSSWEENTLSLRLKDVPGGELIAAAYCGPQMMAAAGAQVSPGKEKADLSFSRDLEQGWTVKTFLLDEKNVPLLPAETMTLPEPSSGQDPQPSGSRILIACFSFTGHTREAAEKAAELTGGDLFEIVPEIPYTEADKVYYDPSSRAYQEQQDPSARPAIAPDCRVEDMDRYDVVLLGYPIWYGAPPKLLYTFLESYDLTGKTVAAFSTSASSGHSDSALRALAPGASWLTGKRFPIGADMSAVEAWISGLDLPVGEEVPEEKLKISANGHDLIAEFEDNSSAEALKELLRSGPLTVEMRDYGSFEKVGPLGHTLPRNDVNITTVPGDVILYQGNQITIYYDRNNWDFTRLARIEGASKEGLLSVFGSGNVTVAFSLVRI